MTFNGKHLPRPDYAPRAQPEWPNDERNALMDPERIRDEGKVPSNQADDRVPIGDEEEHLTVLTEILTLSPPSPGCERTARLVLRRFTLKELRVLAKALRDGNDLKRS